MSSQDEQDAANRRHYQDQLDEQADAAIERYVSRYGQRPFGVEDANDSENESSRQHEQDDDRSKTDK